MDLVTQNITTPQKITTANVHFFLAYSIFVLLAYDCIRYIFARVIQCLVLRMV